MAKAPRPADIDTRAIAARLLREALPSRWRLYALSLVCMVGVAGFTAALAWSTEMVVNDVFVAGNADAAFGIAALLIFIALAKSGFDYVNAVISVLFTRSISAAYQKRIFARLMDKDVSHFLGTHAAAHQARVKLYGEACGKVVVNLSNKLLTDLLTLIALIGVMVWQDAVMSLISLVLFPAIFFLISGLSRRIRAVAKEESRLNSQVQSIGVEAFSGIRTIKSYGLEAKSAARFDAAVEALEARIFGIARVTSATMPVMQVLGGVVLGGFVIYAAWQTITVGKSPGEFTAFITAFLMAYQPAERVSKIWVDVQKNLVHAGEMYATLDAPPIRAAGGTQALEGRAPDVAFEGVRFEYEQDVPALHGVTFEIAAGERVAIVGGSGAGKTTLIDLVQRFYDPTKGVVRIGGVDLREAAEDSVRGTIALISQDVFLFEGTIADNIRDGRPGASEAEVARAARLAALDDVAEGLPDGLKSDVGPGGSALSGGQKQRVGIARALVRDARIIIFDEATSALDQANEQRILRGIVAEAAEATLLFVTHRPAVLAYVDRVLFLERGRIVGFDTHTALTAQSPAYRALFNLPENAAAE